MRNCFISVFISVVLFSSCEKKETFKYYSFDIYPVNIYNSGAAIETDFFSDENLSFQLNSNSIFENYSDFEKLDILTCSFYSDKDFIINSDTIKAGENLLKNLDNDIFSLKRYIGDYGKEYDWYYLIIKSSEDKKINISNGYYQFYFKGKTENDYDVNDSLIVKYIKNR